MVPIGGIIQWPRPIIEIPSNYQLCDGTNGTPDMRDQFVIGAGGAKAVNDTGGADIHIHDFLGLGHTHANGGVVSVAGAGPSTAWDGAGQSGQANVIGPTEASNNIPPFHSLFYIQRMS